MHTYTVLGLAMLFGLFVTATGDASTQKEQYTQSQSPSERPFYSSLPLKLTTELHTLTAKEKQPRRQPVEPAPRTSSRIQMKEKPAIQMQPVPKMHTPRSAKSAPELLKLAESEWQQGHLGQAKSLYETLLKQFPNYPHNHLIMLRVADILQRQQSLNAALRLYGKILDTYPGTQGALISQIRMAELGLASPELLPKSSNPTFESYHKPIQGLLELIRHYPSNQLADIARFKIADHKIATGDFNSALTILRYLSRKRLQEDLAPLVQQKLGQAIQRLLTALQHQEDYTEVLQTFYSYRPLLAVHNIMNPELILPVAESYARLGLFAEAESLLQWLLTVNPTEMPKTLQASDQENALFLVEQSRKSARPLSTAETGVIRSKMLLQLGDWALQNDRPKKAIGYLKQADLTRLSIHDRLRLFVFLTDAYLDQNDMQNGTRIVRKCLGLLTNKSINATPESEICLHHAGELMFNDHQYEASLEAYRHLLQTFPQSEYRERALFHMSLIHQELGQQQEAVENLQMLRDKGSGTLWKKVAVDALDHLTWQKRLYHRLTELQNGTVQ
jgi:TolA-binding protein